MHPEVGDPDRLAAVDASGLLDRAGVESLDKLASVAAQVLDAPMAFVTVVDDRRSWWVSCIGVPGDVRENTVEESFCQYVVADGAPVIIDDAAVHPRTMHNPSVTSMGVRAWAGFPVRGPGGGTLGSFCVVDTVPRTWTDRQVAVLGALAEAASAQISVLVSAEAEIAALGVAARERSLSRRTADRIHHLAVTALEMTSADTYEDLAAVVVSRALPLFEADGGALLVLGEDDTLRTVLGEEFGDYAPPDPADRSLDDLLPGRYSARSGVRVLLPTRAAGLAFSVHMAQVYESSGRQAWAFLPLRTGSEQLGALAVSWTAEHPFGEDELLLMESFAAQCSQAVYRIRQLGRAREGALRAQQLSESLQRSLLTQPPTPEGYPIAVRYEPAAEAAHVGGDWYDAFVTADGATTLAIGDVTGHDQLAAAAMGQIRNLLRGIAYHGLTSPGALLSLLDTTLAGLDVGTLATAVLARIEEDPLAGPGRLRVRWSNAGHLPPLLRQPDGTVDVLERPANLMLGYDASTRRHEHSVPLAPGSLLLLYTDGLVEGRHASPDEGIGRLAELLGDLDPQDPEAVCDAILAAGIVTDTTDDTALLALYRRP